VRKVARVQIANLNNVIVNNNANILPQDVIVNTNGKLKISFLTNTQGTLLLVVNGVPGIINYNGQTSQNLQANTWYYFEYQIIGAERLKPVQPTSPNQIPPPPQIEGVSINFQFQISSSVTATSATVTLIAELETP